MSFRHQHANQAPMEIRKSFRCETTRLSFLRPSCLVQSNEICKRDMHLIPVTNNLKIETSSLDSSQELTRVLAAMSG
jgi:hypothetical protein